MFHNIKYLYCLESRATQLPKIRYNQEILRNSGLYRQHQVIANNFDGFIKMSTEPIQNQRFLAKPLPTHCNYRIYVSKHYEK